MKLSKKFIAVPAITLAAGISLAACGPAKASSAPAASSSAPAAVATTPAPPVATTPAPAAAPTTPAAPAMSSAEQQAVDSAQSYLADGQGFSQSGLFNQLTSSSGEGFTAANADFAISYLKPDWNAQAVESAKGYLADGQGFSHAELIQQLTSSSGEGFTEAQAEYAVAKAGL